MQAFRAPSTGIGLQRRDASSRKGQLGAEMRMPSSSASNMNRRIVSQGLARTQQRPGELGTPNSPAAALQVDNTSFEEWMKMATDNKINATNTWSFALIDYFHDMSLLRSDSGDGSINFQKASCTLDGCVKVWTSRVDSVMAETGRLLSGLQDEDAATQSKNGSSAVDPHEVGDESRDDDEDGDERRHTRRRARAHESTLAKSFAQLQVKRFDLEFSVDPLFKKTSADFDEDGAGGLLMNHLHVDDQMKVVFDASDGAVTSRADEQDDAREEGPEDGEGQEAGDGADAEHAGTGVTGEEATISQYTPQQVPGFDLEKLRARLFAAAAQTDSSVLPSPAEPLRAILDTRMICPSTSTFTFADGNEAQLPTIHFDDEMLGDGMDMDVDDEPGADDVDFFDGQVGDIDDDERAFDVAFAHDAQAPRASAEPLDDHGRLLDYFDHKMHKNWAGPEHWKMTRLHASLAPPAAAAPSAPVDEASAAAEKANKVRRAREAQVIDFLGDEPPPPAKELFAPSATPSAIKLSKASQAGTDRHLLPEDHHFNSKRLLRLFLKPKAQILLQQKRARQSRATPGMDGAWDDDDMAWAAPGAGDEGGDGAAFDTGLFEEHDPYEDVLPPALALEAEAPPADEFDVDSDIDEDAWGAEALRRVRPDFVDHARRAKQVDVKKLKDNIWTTLDLQNDEPKEFDVVLENLQAKYPPAKYSEISTSFCFICLLHLANEEGLAIDVPSDDEPSSPGAILSAARDGNGSPSADAHVGRLGALRVRRDPHVE